MLLFAFVVIMLTIGYLYNYIVNGCKHEWETIKEEKMMNSASKKNSHKEKLPH